MTPEDSYKLATTLAAHRLLIRELVVLTFSRLPDPMQQLDGFTTRLASGLDQVTFPGLDATASDLMAQEVAEVAKGVLEEAKSKLASLLSGSKP